MKIFIQWDKLKNSYLSQLPEDADVIIGPEMEPNQTTKLLLNIQGREEVIFVYHSMVKLENTPLSFDELLLDERYSCGYIYFPIKYMKEFGYLNERLPAKRIYEWLLRVAEKVTVIGKRPLSSMNDLGEEIQMTGSEAEFQADCYIVGKYADRLRQLGYFEEVLQGLVVQAGNGRNVSDRMGYLEQMLGRTEKYFGIEDGTAPILFYHGVTYCYNIMNVLAVQLEQAMIKQGERIEIYDEQQEGMEGLVRYMGKRFKAIVGIQTYLMSIFLKHSDKYLHDELKGPKFNMVLDHPIWLRDLLKHVPQDYYILTHDENYRQFIHEYYCEVSGTFLFPPAGIWNEEELSFEEERKYDITLIGTYGDYREKCNVIRQCVPEVRRIALRFLHYLKREPDWTAEMSFQRTLKDCNVYFIKETFVNMFFEMRAVVQLIMYYYREKTIRTLLDAGIIVNIWGTSWEKSPMAKHPYLRIHKDIESPESIAVLKKSKISLNVMAWHKGGFTERMANSMLAGAMVLTDKTTYHEFGMRSGSQLIMFSLAEIDKLPLIVKEILQDDKRRFKIAKCGYEYAQNYHTWDKRAKQLLEIIDTISGREGV